MDYYNILGISRSASSDEIKKAYRKLAMEHHPDKGGDPIKFQQINEAYETLGDANKRAAYDNPMQQSFGQFPGGFSFNVNGFDINDLFGQVFGRNNQSFNQKPTYRTRVAVSLVDAYNGSDHFVQLHTPDGVKAINIKIPAGVKTGDQVKYENLISNAILIIEFHVLNDVRFERHHNDLFSTVSISVLDLIVGTKIEVNTIKGTTIEVTINPKTQPSQQIRVAGYGMPLGNGQYGDQILLIKPVIPDNIDNDVIESIKRHQATKGK